MPSILLTGFEPFGGSTINVSAEAVRYISPESISAVQLHTRILPVDSESGPTILHALLTEIQPDWCLMLGQSSGAAALMIERVALNLCDFRIPDNNGHQLCDQPIVADGPAAYFATLPVRALLNAAWAVDVPAALSMSAGTYVCNMLMYHALHICDTRGLATRCGFIHLPTLPAQAHDERTPRPTMALATITSGLRAMLETLAVQDTLHVPPDRFLAAG